jgi:hypothetical protein
VIVTTATHALRGPSSKDGHIGFRRTAYYVAGVIAQLEQIGHPSVELITGRLRRAAP